MVRKATIKDIEIIYNLINNFADKGSMLSRSLNSLFDSLRDFVVITNEREEIIGCGALHISWYDLGEIKSLAMDICGGKYVVLTHGGKRRDIAEFIFPMIIKELAKH